MDYGTLVYDLTHDDFEPPSIERQVLTMETMDNSGINPVDLDALTTSEDESLRTHVRRLI